MEHKSIKWIFVVLIVCEWVGLIILGIAAYRFIRSRSVAVANPKIIPLEKDRLIFDPDGQLKYYYNLKPGVATDSASFWNRPPVIYTVNSDGIRATKTYSLEKPPHTYRIVTLGDSFTFGIWIGDDQTWPAVLEQMLTKAHLCTPPVTYEVINLGVPGYDISYAVRHFIDLGLKYSPDLVLWLIKDDDFFDVNEVMMGWTNSAYATMSAQEKYSQLNTENDPDHVAIKEFQKKYSESQIKMLQTAMIQRFIAAYHGRLAFMTRPALVGKYLDQLDAWSLMDRGQAVIFDDINYIQPGLSLPDGHPNELGHKTIAEDAFADLMKVNFACPE